MTNWVCEFVGCRSQCSFWRAVLKEDPTKEATKKNHPKKKNEKGKEKDKDKGEERIKEFQLFFTSSHVWSLEL